MSLAPLARSVTVRGVTESGVVTSGTATIPYTVVRSSRRRRTIEISVNTEAGVIVRAPERAAKTLLHELVERRIPWILARQRALAERPAQAPLADGASVRYMGRTFALRVVESPGARSVCLASEELRVALPVGGAPGAVQAALEAWLRAEAAVVFEAAVARFAPLMGVTPGRVLVRDQRRRWGSCGQDGTLRFNWRLIMAPPEVIDLVAVHELAHLRHRNHSPAFWAEVARALPDYQSRRVQLRAIGRSLQLEGEAEGSARGQSQSR